MISHHSSLARAFSAQRLLDLQSFSKLVGCQTDADQLPVVAGEYALLGKSGVRPNGHPAFDRLGRLNQLSPTEFLVTVVGELGQDQLALLVANEYSVVVGHQKRVPPTAFAGCLMGFPQRFAPLAGRDNVVRRSCQRRRSPLRSSAACT